VRTQREGICTPQYDVVRLRSGGSPEHFTLATPFEPDQSKWIDTVCFNIDDPNDAREYRLGTRFDSPHFGERAIVETFEELLHRYFYHPESKSLGPDGEPCQQNTWAPTETVRDWR